MRRVWTLGEAMAALVTPGTGPAELADQVRVGTGGAELNVAIGLARLGHEVTWIGVVGDDPWGRRVVRDLNGEGVDARVRTSATGFTGADRRERRARGLTRATYLRRGSAGSQLGLPDIEALEAGPGDILHLTCLTPLLSETAAAAWSRAARRARAAGALVSLDINYRRALGSPAQVEKAFAEIAHQVDVLFASPDEAAIVCGHPDLDIDAATAVTLLTSKLSAGSDIVIKDGADGSLHFASDGVTTLGSAVPVSIADLVGAGDAFAAGYLSALIDDEPVARRLSRAHACAAFVVASDGDWQGAPHREELDLTASLAEEQVHR